MPPQMQILPSSEGTRKLPSTAITTVNAATLSINIPVDTVIRSALMRLSGSVTTTFASGTPVADAQSTMDNLFGTIVCAVDGRIVKSVAPHLMHMQQILTSTVQGERDASAGASAVGGTWPTTDGGFVYGTTTQITTVRESILISFQQVYCDYGKNATCLDTRGRSNCGFTIYQNNFSSLLGFGNTAPVVFSAQSMNLDVTLNEWVDAPKNEFLDWKQTYRDETISAQVTQKQFALNTGAKLSGIMIFTRDGAAGSTTTATGKLAKDTILTNLQILTNGQRLVKATDWGSVKADNRIRLGANSPYASNVSRMDGVIYWNFINRQDIRTALDLSRAAGVNTAVLQCDSNSSSVIDFTNPVNIRIQQDEIVRP